MNVHVARRCIQRGPTVLNKPSIDREQELPERDQSASQRQARHRQWLTILFALVLLSMASLASAENPSSIQYDGSTAVSATRFSGGALAMPGDRENRPAYVEMSAALANFDADADPDGWRANIVLRDRNDAATVMRCRASFELMPRVPTLTGAQYFDGYTAPIRWTMPLEFSDDAIATVKLPLRKSLRPVLGWSNAAFPHSGLRSRHDGIERRKLRLYSRPRSFITSDLEHAIGMPNQAELRVRVSVPTVGVFESVTPVQLRPSVLVDTSWPYR